MLVHVCAAYKLSPVGVQPGSFIWKKNTSGDLNLINKPSCKLPYAIFENGFITGVNGKLPNNSIYLFLTKDIEYSYENHEEFGKIIYANLIFEFNNARDYSEFANGYQALSPEVSSKMIADFIIPDRIDKEFALHIDSSNFSLFIDEVNRHSTTNVDTSNTFVVTTNTPNTRYAEQLYKLFGVFFDKEREKYIYPKKTYPDESNESFSFLNLLFSFRSGKDH